MQDAFQLQKTFAFFLRHLFHRDACPSGHHLGNILFPYHIPGSGLSAIPRSTLFFQFIPQGIFLITESGCFFVILGVNGFALFQQHTLQRFFHFLHIGRGGEGLNTHPGSCFVHQVNRLVRLETVGNVPAGQLHSRFQRFIGDVYLMMRFIPVPQSLHDGDGFLIRGFFHRHRLEASGQRRIFFNMLSVFIQRSGADALDLPTGQRGLENIGGIHTAFRLSGPHNVLQFVNEQNHIAAFSHFIQCVLQSFFKFTPVFAAGHHGPHIQGNDLFAIQVFGDGSLHDLLGQPFRHGRFTHPGFTDQHRIVFGSSGKDLDDPFNFGLTADHRIQFSLSRRFGEIPAIFLQTGIVFLSAGSIGSGRGFLHHALQYRLAYLFHIRTHAGQHPHGHAVFIHQQTQPEMPAGHIGHAQPLGLPDAVFQQLFHAGGKLQPQRLFFPGAADLLHRFRYRFRNHLIRQPRRITACLTQQPDQHMLAAHIFMPHFQCCPLCRCDHQLGPFVKPSENCHFAPPAMQRNMSFFIYIYIMLYGAVFM